jgi:hypothetical protein
MTPTVKVMADLAVMDEGAVMVMVARCGISERYDVRVSRGGKEKKEHI